MSLFVQKFGGTSVADAGEDSGRGAASDPERTTAASKS